MLQTKDAVLSAVSKVIDPSGRYFILAGAGVSVDSGLPAAGTFMKTLLRRIGQDLRPMGLGTRLLRLMRRKRRDPDNYLRFEWLLQYVRDYYDEALDVLSVYGDLVPPNRNHYVLASLLSQGHMVCTPNFDCLVEEACCDLGIPFTQIYRDEDFERWLDSPRSSLNPIFKIHGSWYRYRGAHRTLAVDSIRATLDQVGEQGLEFSRAAGKREFLKKMLTSYDMLVLGYSGGDDFDLCRTFERQESERRVIWIDHQKAGWDRFTGREVVRREPPNVSSCWRLLAKMCSVPDGGVRSARKPGQVYLFRCRTAAAIDILTGRFGISGRWHQQSNETRGRKRAWLAVAAWADRYLSDAPWKPYHLAGEIFRYFEARQDFERCARAGWRFGSAGDPAARVMTGYLQSWNLWNRDHHSEGARHCQPLTRAVCRASTAPAGYLKGLAEVRYLHAEHLSMLGESSSARRAGRRALSFLNVQIRRFRRQAFFRKVKADLLTTLANLSISLGQWGRGSHEYQRSLKSYESIGDIYGVAYSLGSVGDIYRVRGRLDQAESTYEDAIRLSRQIGYRWNVGWCRLGLAEVFRRKGSRALARRALTEAEAIFGDLAALKELATVYRALGDFYRVGRQYSDARSYYRKAEHAYRKAEAALEAISVGIGLIDIDRVLGKQAEAIKGFRKAYLDARKLGARLEQAHALLALADLGVKPRTSIEKAYRIYVRTGCKWGREESRRLSRGGAQGGDSGNGMPLDFVYFG